jgi:MFS family permease
VVALQFLPTLLIGPWFGALADRHDRRRLLMLAETGLALVAAGYAAAAAAGVLTMPAVYLLATAWGLINALDTPARRAMVPMLVRAELATSAASLTGPIMLIGMTAGSALGGVLVGTLGVVAAFGINAASFAFDVVLLATIRVGRSPRVARAPGQVREGLRYAYRTATVRRPLLAIALLATFGFTLPVTLPLLVRLEFTGGPELIGTGLTVAMAGSLAGAVAMAARRSTRPPSLAVASAGMTGALIVVAVAPTVPVAFAALSGVGFAWSACIAAVIATLQTADLAMTGRVMAIFAAVLLGGTAVGGPPASVLATLAGPRWPFVLGALAAALATALASGIRWAGPLRRPARSVAAE